MATLLDETLMPFAEGIRSLPGRPHVSTGYRFISKGSRGVILETVLVGGRRFTSQQALRRFIAAVTAAAEPRAAPPPPPPSKSGIADERITRRLDDAGI